METLLRKNNKVERGGREREGGEERGEGRRGGEGGERIPLTRRSQG